MLNAQIDKLISILESFASSPSMGISISLNVEIQNYGDPKPQTQLNMEVLRDKVS